MTWLVLLLVGVVVGLLVLPSLWTRAILQRHNRTRSELPHSGQSLAAHLIELFQLQDVKLEMTATGQDHYDPTTHTVRLGENHWQTRSLSAMAVAAHEVGHALQDATHYRGLRLRVSLARLAHSVGQVSNVALLAAPVVMLLTRSPMLGALVLGLAIAGFLMSALVHVVTLPVEFDASFKRALPILRDSRLLSEQDLRQAHRILTACALTYVAQSLMSFLQLGRWLRFLRP